jgi:hypothetical protein
MRIQATKLKRAHVSRVWPVSADTAAALRLAETRGPRLDRPGGPDPLDQRLPDAVVQLPGDTIIVTGKVIGIDGPINRVEVTSSNSTGVSVGPASSPSARRTEPYYGHLRLSMHQPIDTTRGMKW